MTKQDTSLKGLIHSEREREPFMALNWEGSFEDYLELVEGNPLICRNAFQRMLDMIEQHGCELAQPAIDAAVRGEHPEPRCL